MGFVEAVSTCLSKSFDWGGRASRSEYWWFTLAVILANFGAAMVMAAAETVGLILFVIVILGGLAAATGAVVRRLHDTGRSGWYYWISLIPIIGGFILLWMLIQPSEARQNAYGPPPT
jgi:uncharacterized membrane protein YhaH (DUF805 family)